VVAVIVMVVVVVLVVVLRMSYKKIIFLLVPAVAMLHSD
jgi:hypothetical protein